MKEKDEVEDIVEVGNEKVNLSDVIRKNFTSLKKGDFSMLANNETEAFLKFIGFFVNKYRSAFKKDESEDIVYEVFNRVIQSKLYNLEINRKEKPTTYLGLIVKGAIERIITERGTDLRKANYDESIKEGLDTPKSHKPDDERTKLNSIPSNEKSNLQSYVDDSYNSFIKSAFEKDEILKLYFIDNMSCEKIGKQFGFSRQMVYQKIDRSLAFLKMELAEKGYFDKIEVDENDRTEYFYLRKRITQNGITSVNLVDDIPIETLSKYLNINEEHISSKIKEDERVVCSKFEQVNLRAYGSTKKYLTELFVNIFDKYSKNFAKIPNEWIQYVTENVISNESLKYYFIYPITLNFTREYWKKRGLDSEQVEAIVYENVYKLKDKVKNILKSTQ